MAEKWEPFREWTMYGTQKKEEGCFMFIHTCNCRTWRQVLENLILIMKWMLTDATKQPNPTPVRIWYLGARSSRKSSKSFRSVGKALQGCFFICGIGFLGQLHKGLSRSVPLGRDGFSFLAYQSSWLWFCIAGGGSYPGFFYIVYSVYWLFLQCDGMQYGCSIRCIGPSMPRVFTVIFFIIQPLKAIIWNSSGTTNTHKWLNCFQNDRDLWWYPARLPF